VLREVPDLEERLGHASGSRRWRRSRARTRACSRRHPSGRRGPAARAWRARRGRLAFRTARQERAPGMGASGSGTVPGIVWRRSPSCTPNWGVLRRSAWRYGCWGSANSSLTGPVSITWPQYMTVTRSAT
jgi:hypothetical protein